MVDREVFDRLRRPEYTGENRCTPCTVVNAVIAGTLSLVVLVGGRAAGAGAVGAGLAAAGVLLVSAAAIALRGYLVPGTPWLTRTYLPDRVLRWFDKDPATDVRAAGVEGDRTATGGGDPGGEADGGGDGDGDVDVEATMKRAGALAECENEDDLCLTEGFGAAWRERVARLREGEATRRDLARVLEVDPDRLDFEEYGGAFVARLDGHRTGQWESRAAFLADLAAANELRERLDDWTDLGVERRSSMLRGLRVFLERCPACDGEVSLDKEVVESCCRSVDVVAVTCRDCGSRVFEAEQPG